MGRPPDERRLVYSTDPKEVVKAARAHGFSDREILELLTANEYGVRAKKDIIRKYAAALGLSEEEALAEARKAGIVT